MSSSVTPSQTTSRRVRSQFRRLATSSRMSMVTPALMPSVVCTKGEVSKVATEKVRGGGALELARWPLPGYFVVTVAAKVPLPWFSQVMVPFWNSVSSPPPVTAGPAPLVDSSPVGNPSRPVGPPAPR